MVFKPVRVDLSNIGSLGYLPTPKQPIPTPPSSNDHYNSSPCLVHWDHGLIQAPIQPNGGHAHLHQGGSGHQGGGPPQVS